MVKVYDAEAEERRAVRAHAAQLAEIRAYKDLFGDLDLPIMPMPVYYPRPHLSHGSLHFKPEHFQASFAIQDHLAALVAALPPIAMAFYHKRYRGCYPPEAMAVASEDAKEGYGVDNGTPIMPLTLELNLAHYGSEAKVVWFTKPKDKIIEVSLKVHLPRNISYGKEGSAELCSPTCSWQMSGGTVNRWEHRYGGGYCEGSSRYVIYNTNKGGGATEWVERVLNTFARPAVGANGK